jgi:hypothetical protein
MLAPDRVESRTRRLDVRPSSVRWAVCVVVLAATAACDAGAKQPGAGHHSAGLPTRSAGTPAKASASPTPKGSTTKRRAQPPAPDCIKGWVEPARDTALRSLPLALLREAQGLDGLFSIVDMRYFKGPDDTNLAPDGGPSDVERWYAKVVHTRDRSFRLRFLARRSSVGAGIVAIAPFNSRGFAAGDWRGFDGEGGPKIYPGLPGRWPAAPYDYVASGELPPQVVGCLAN